MEIKQKSLSECQILVVDDEPGSRVLISSLVSQSIPCDCAATGKEAIEYCMTKKPDLILLDMEMPHMNGIEVCQAIKNNPQTADIAVIFITASIEDDVQNRCWEAKGNDFIRKPVNASTLFHRINLHLSYKLQLELMEKFTFQDQLTGLYNRSYLSQEIPKVLRQCIRDSAPLSVILFDVDNFKILNDTQGHLFGDVVLAKVAMCIKNALRRPSDKAIRYGGEEFLVILPETDANGAIHIAEQVLENVRALQIENRTTQIGTLTISAGTATAPQLLDIDLLPLLNQADVRLYKAKNAGKNQVVSDTTHTLQHAKQRV